MDVVVIRVMPVFRKRPKTMRRYVQQQNHQPQGYDSGRHEHIFFQFHTKIIVAESLSNKLCLAVWARNQKTKAASCCGLAYKHVKYLRVQYCDLNFKYNCYIN